MISAFGPGALQLSLLAVVGIETFLSHQCCTNCVKGLDLHHRNTSFLACCNLPISHQSRIGEKITYAGYHRYKDTWVRRCGKWNRSRIEHYPDHHIHTCQPCYHTQDRGNKNNHRSFDHSPFGSDPCYRWF